MKLKLYANTGTVGSKVEIYFDFDEEETKQWRNLNIFEKKNFIIENLIDYGLLDFGWEIVKEEGA